MPISLRQRLVAAHGTVPIIPIGSMLAEQSGEKRFDWTRARDHVSLWPRKGIRCSTSWDKDDLIESGRRKPTATQRSEHGREFFCLDT